MKDQTMIALAGMFGLLLFGAFLIQKGYDGYLAGSIIFVVASTMGVLLPQPGFLRTE
ncbi:hypothetical protein LCGC14_1769520 [marine sediment metagenome]|uniref:Uncharacterized protein n=1 Tax=marine sediment metagenome TaxID=412755 RepID=A0A0F9JDM5_9ZZZZ